MKNLYVTWANVRLLFYYRVSSKIEKFFRNMKEKIKWLRFKRQNKLYFELNKKEELNLDNDDVLVAYARGFFSEKSGKIPKSEDHYMVQQILLSKLRERGLEHKVFSSYSIGHLVKFDLGIPMPKVKPPKQEDDRHPLQEGYMPEGNDEDAIPTTGGSGLVDKGHWKNVCKRVLAASEVIHQKHIEMDKKEVENYKRRGLL